MKKKPDGAKTGKKFFRETVFLLILALAIFITLNNCDFTQGNKTVHDIRFLAHRGLAQTFDIATVKWDTDTARIIHKPEHPYIENTVLSMEAAFRFGAEIVELDLRVTKDLKLAVFHDFTLDYRTDGTGKVCDYTMDELRLLDVGYGYTHDDGKTFPLRGTGIGLMPSFEDILDRFPGKKFLVHLRDEGPLIGEQFLERLRKMDRSQTDQLSVYGNDQAIELIKKEYPQMKALTLKLMKKALLEYELLGWTGYIPKSMRNLEIHLPIDYARYLWGWPTKFLARMESAGTRFVLVTKQGAWSGGFDTQGDLKKVPFGYSGYLWTERIDVVGPLSGK